MAFKKKAKEVKHDVKTESAKLADFKVETKKEEKEIESTKVTKREEKREVISSYPVNGKAILSVNGKIVKAKCYFRRRDKAVMVGIGPMSVEVGSWLKGEADLV